MPGGTISRRGPALGSVMLIMIVSLVKSVRCHPGGWCLSWAVEEQKCSSTAIFLLFLSPRSVMVKRPNSRTFCLLYPDFPTKHMHMELCDWLNFLKVKSSGYFTYLSARRSWLKTSTPDETIAEVSPSHPNYLGGQYSPPYLLQCPLY